LAGQARGRLLGSVVPLVRLTRRRICDYLDALWVANFSVDPSRISRY